MFASIVAGVLTAGLVALAVAPAQADDYPSRPIRFIVGFAAGGGNDLFARLVLQKFQEQTGATAIVENKAGAGGRIASDYVSKQAARRLHGSGRRHRADRDRHRDLSPSRL